MTVKCKEVMEYINDSASALFSCETENEIVIIKTPFTYPDGDDIELYLEMKSDNSYLLSDMGEALRYLYTYSINITNSNKRKSIIEDAVNMHNIIYNNGVFYSIIKNVDNILDAIINLSQALLRVSDMVYTVRGVTAGVFREEVIALLEDNNVGYEKNHQIKSPISESIYTFDFAIDTKKGVNLMDLATTSKEGGKPSIARHIKAWFDIDTGMPHEYPKENRITLLDDLSYPWRPNDYNLLQKLSQVYKWSEKDHLLHRLNNIIT